MLKMRVYQNPWNQKSSFIFIFQHFHCHIHFYSVGMCIVYLNDVEHQRKIFLRNSMFLIKCRLISNYYLTCLHNQRFKNIMSDISQRIVSDKTLIPLITNVRLILEPFNLNNISSTGGIPLCSLKFGTTYIINLFFKNRN